MDRIRTATCPRCGAQLQPAPGAEQATCAYCGTTSFIQQPPAPPPNAPGAQRGVPVLPIAVGCGVVLVLAAGVVSYMLLRSTAAITSSIATATVATPSQPAPQPTLASAPTASGATPEQAPVKVIGSFTPLLLDDNGDGSDDVVIALSTLGSPETEHYAVLDGRTGRELARTPAITDLNQAVTTVAGRRVIAASRAGQLTSYSVGNGSQQWTTALGARVAMFCAAKSDDALLVATDDQRRLSLDLTTGRQSATKEACTAVLARADHNDDPRDRRDYQAPRGTESYWCGGVTVMGDQNYTVPDQCLARAHVDTDHLDGLIGHRLWKSAQNWLVFGIRTPGAHVPMVGLIAHGRLAWKAEVPQDNPLEAREGSPQSAGLSGDLLITTYATAKDNHWFVAAFAVADGARRWTVPLAAKGSVSALTTSADRVFVTIGETLTVLAAADGKQIASVGKDE